MKPAAIARELVFPLTELGVMLAIIVFTLLNALASAASLLGIWLYVVIVPAFFRYLLYLLEARAHGRAAPVPGIELFNWVENFWSLFPLLLLALIAWGGYLLATSVSRGAAIAFCLPVLVFMPASMAVLAVTRSPVESLNPRAILQVIKACRSDYLLILLQFGLMSILVLGLIQLGARGIVLGFALFYVAVLLFTFTGAVLRSNGHAIEIDIPQAREADEDELRAQLLKDRQVVANHAYGFISRGNRAGGLQHIDARIQQESDPDDARRWFFNEMLQWESSDAALFFAQAWLSKLLCQQKNIEALKLVSRCLLENAAFRPLAEDRDTIIELARQAKHEDLLRQLR